MMSIRRAWPLAILVAFGLPGCADAPPADPGLAARRASYLTEDDALRARFAPENQTGGSPVTVGAAPGYVPDRTCRGCHPFDRSRSLGMERSLSAPSPRAVVEDFESANYYHESSQRHYEMIHEDGSYEVIRYQVDEDGTRYNELSRPVDSIVGSGHKCRAYVYRTPTDELYQLPLAWYSDARKWRMAPGYEGADHSGFLRQITRDCMFCHNAYPDVSAGSDRLGQRQTFPEKLPQGVGCQRCHGPGADHVSAANSVDSTPEEIRTLIFNSSRLAPEHQNEVCMQCHLQADSSMMSIVRRLDRSDYSYRPGQLLSDYIGHVDHDANVERYQINHHPYRLLQSQCHIASEGRLTCVTCHDPHEKPLESERTEHFRNACLTCHDLEQCDTAAMQATGSSLESVACVSCHMPQRRTGDVIEVVTTDHLITRTPPDEDLTAWRPRAPVVPAGSRSLFHGNLESTSMPGHLADISGTVAGNPESSARLEKAIESGEAPGIDALLYLANSQWNLRAYAKSLATFRRALELDPDRALVQRMIGRALIELGQASEAEPWLERARALDPGDPEITYGLALASHRLGRKEAALEGFRAALEQRPLHIDSHLGMASVLVSQRRYAEAAEAYRWVHRIDPGRADAYLYRGTMLVLLGNRDEAVTSWRRGRRVAPDSAPLAGAWAVALFYRGAHEEALRTSEEAAAAGADPGVCLLVAAMAQYTLGRSTEATATLARAEASPAAKGPEAILRAVLIQEARQRLGRG